MSLLTAAQIAALDRADPNSLADELRAMAFGTLLAKVPQWAAASELTIASGVVTVTQDLHSIDTESDGASDDLDTISGGNDGQLLFVRPASGARTVVLKHGTGNIFNPRAVDISMADATDLAALLYDGVALKWTVLAASLLAKPGATYTQTYSTTATTVPAATSHAITDSSGGSASTSAIAAITTGGAAADQAPTRNAIATLAAEAELVKADLLVVKKLVNQIIDDLQAAGISA